MRRPNRNRRWSGRGVVAYGSPSTGWFQNGRRVPIGPVVPILGWRGRITGERGLPPGGGRAPRRRGGGDERESGWQRSAATRRRSAGFLPVCSRAERRPAGLRDRLRPGHPRRARRAQPEAEPGGGAVRGRDRCGADGRGDRKSTRLNSSHVAISYDVFCVKKKLNIQLL